MKQEEYFSCVFDESRRFIEEINQQAKSARYVRLVLNDFEMDFLSMTWKILNS